MVYECKFQTAAPQNNHIKNSSFIPLKTPLALSLLVQWYLSLQCVRTPNSALSSARLLSWLIYLFVCLFVFLEYVVKKRIQTWSTESMISRYIPKITWLDTDLPPTLGSVLKSSPQSILCPYNLSHCCSFSSYVCLYRMSMQLWHNEFDFKCIYAVP